MTNRRHFMLLLALLPAGNFAFAQEVKPRAIETVQVTVVEVPVYVVDRSGSPVRGLSKENFELTDEGRIREITHFEMIDLTGPELAQQNAPLNPAARRSFLLLFDLNHSDPAALLRSRDAARDFVLNRLKPQDLAAVASYSVEQGFKIASSFTFDRERLSQAIDALGLPQFFQSGDPLFIASMANALKEREGTTGGATSRNTASTAADAMNELLESMSRTAKTNTDDYRRGRLRQQMNSFANLARVLDSVRGRKQIVLLSSGFDARLIQGRESQSSSEAQAEGDAVLSGEIWKVDTDVRYGSSSSVNVLSQMGDIFKRSDVVIHTIDIKGVRGAADLEGGTIAPNTIETPAMTDAGRPASNESLFLMANETGGQFFRNANDLRQNFDKMLRQQEVVYILGFQALSSGTPGKFHNLKVRLRKVPGGARTSYRAGYYEPRSNVAPMERALSLVEILMNDISQDELSLDTLAAPFPTSEANPQVPVVVEIDGRSLLEGLKGSALASELFLYAFDRDNVVRDFLYQKVSLDLTKVGDSVRKNGLKFYGALNLPPGDYVVKTLVRTVENDRTGFQKLTVRVPDFKQPVVLQPFFVEEGVSWVMVKGAPRRAAEVDYPFVIGRESFVPAIAPHLKNDVSYKVALFTWNMPLESLQLGAMLRRSDGSTTPAAITLKGRTPADASGASNLLFEFRPAALAAGAYRLDFNIRRQDQASGEQLSVPFIVE